MASVKQTGAMDGESGRAIVIAPEKNATRHKTATKEVFMAQDTPDIAQAMGFLANFLQQISFTRPSKDESLGHDVAMTIIHGVGDGTQGGILSRCAAKVTPEGEPWPENKPDYADEKEKQYGWRDVNRRTGQLTSEASLYGRTTISPEEVTMRYGTGEPPSASESPTGYISEQDRRVTDIEKSAWATEGGRGFYGWNGEDRANVVAVCQESVNELIRETNRSNGY